MKIGKTTLRGENVHTVNEHIYHRCMKITRAIIFELKLNLPKRCDFSKNRTTKTYENIDPIFECFIRMKTRQNLMCVILDTVVCMCSTKLIYSILVVLFIYGFCGIQNSYGYSYKWHCIWFVCSFIFILFFRY